MLTLKMINKYIWYNLIVHALEVVGRGSEKLREKLNCKFIQHYMENLQNT